MDSLLILVIPVKTARSIYGFVLNVWKEEKYRTLQGTYPVISLSFAGVKETNYAFTKLAINAADG
mgnify:CR=1 FL=1